MEKILVRNLVSSSQSDELYESDVLLKIDGLLSNEDEVYDYNIVHNRPNTLLDDDDYSSEVTPVRIEALEILLADAKKNGATHVGIYYHSGHWQYEVYGYTYEVGGKEYLEKMKEEEEIVKEQKRQETIGRLKDIAAREGLTIEIK